MFPNLNTIFGRTQIIICIQAEAYPAAIMKKNKYIRLKITTCFTFQFQRAITATCNFVNLSQFTKKSHQEHSVVME